MLDGEAVPARRWPSGFPCAAVEARLPGLMTFDLLGLDGSYLVSLPLHARRAQLAALIDGQGDGLLSRAMSRAPRRGPVRHACALGLEGIVSKKAESRYRSGPRPEWLKINCSTYTR